MRLIHVIFFKSWTTYESAQLVVPQLPTQNILRHVNSIPDPSPHRKCSYFLVVVRPMSVWKYYYFLFFHSNDHFCWFFLGFTFEKLIINDGRHLERREETNYENAFEKAEKERKEINYGNYLVCLPGRLLPYPTPPLKWLLLMRWLRKRLVVWFI